MPASAMKRWRGLERVACVVVLERSLRMVSKSVSERRGMGCLRPFGAGCSGHGRRWVCGDVVEMWGWEMGKVA